MQTAAHPPSVCISKVLLEQNHAPFVYMLSMAAFALQPQSWVVATGTIWSIKPKIFIIQLFTEIVFQPMLYNNTGVGCHSLLQRIFLTQGLNLGLQHCRESVYHLSHQGSPLNVTILFSGIKNCCPKINNNLIFFPQNWFCLTFL